MSTTSYLLVIIGRVPSSSKVSTTLGSRIFSGCFCSVSELAEFSETVGRSLSFLSSSVSKKSGLFATGRVPSSLKVSATSMSPLSMGRVPSSSKVSTTLGSLLSVEGCCCVLEVSEFVGRLSSSSSVNKKSGLFATGRVPSSLKVSATSMSPLSMGRVPSSSKVFCSCCSLILKILLFTFLLIETISRKDEKQISLKFY